MRPGGVLRIWSVVAAALVGVQGCGNQQEPWLLLELTSPEQLAQPVKSLAVHLRVAGREKREVLPISSELDDGRTTVLVLVGEGGAAYEAEVRVEARDADLRILATGRQRFQGTAAGQDRFELRLRVPQVATVYGDGSRASLDYPNGLTVDARGVVHVANTQGHVVLVLESGGPRVLGLRPSTPGDWRSQDGPAATARFKDPVALTAKTDGTLFVTQLDPTSPLRVIADGQVTSLPLPIPVPASLRPDTPPEPRAVALLGPQLLIACSRYQRIFSMTPPGDPLPYAGTAGVAGCSDGPLLQATFDFPRGLAVAGEDLLVAEGGGNVVRRVTSSGTSIVAGQCGQAGYRDGPAASALFSNLTGLAVDSWGYIFVSDFYGNAVRQIAGGEVTTLAGQPSISCTELTPPRSTCFKDGPASSARFFHPIGLAVDAAGKIYVADAANNLIRVIEP